MGQNGAIRHSHRAWTGQRRGNQPGNDVSDVGGGTITINAQPFTNQGLAESVNGGTLSLTGTWNNSGTLAAERRGA